MWLFTKKGAISAVQDRDQPWLVWVRARKQGHLENVLSVVLLRKEFKVKKTPNADYAFRALISKEDFKRVLAAQVDNLDYDNFKDSIVDTAYHSACSKVWYAFLDACQTGCYAATTRLRGGSKSASRARM